MPKYRIRLLYDVKGWAYYRRCKALQKYAPDDFEVTVGADYGRSLASAKHDLVLQLCYSHARDLRRHCVAAGHDLVIVSGFNIGWGYANKWFNDVALWSDHVVVNNRECWDRLGQLPNTTWISNGVDRDTYKITTPPADRQPKAIWTGSKFHSKTKRYDSILKPLAEKLKKAGWLVDFRLVDSHGGATGAKSYRGDKQMVEWYNTGTVYVVASSSEGTPNPALEAASCGCVVASTRVGNMPELIESGVNGELCEGSVDSLFAACNRCRDDYLARQAAMETALQRDGWAWRDRAKQYFDLFRRLIEEKRAGAMLAKNLPCCPATSAMPAMSVPVMREAKMQLRNAVAKYLVMPRDRANSIIAAIDEDRAATILHGIGSIGGRDRAAYLAVACNIARESVRQA